MDLSFIYDWVIQTLKGLSGSTILSLVSISIAFSVFRFNKKMGYSKLSVTPLLSKYDNSIDLTHVDFNYELRELNWIKSTKGLPEPMLSRVVRESDNGKLFDDRFTPQMLLIKLMNKGEIASTDIKVTLVFKGYGSKIIYKKDSIDEFDFEVGKRKTFTSLKIPIKLSYMGAGEEKYYYIADLKGQFREAELILCKIQANGHTYFKQKLSQRFFNRVVINHYFHPYLSSAADPSDIYALVGINNHSEDWESPYPKKKWYEGVLKWLQNLYVGWRK